MLHRWSAKIVLFLGRYIAVQWWYWCSGGAKWLFRENVTVTKGKNGCHVTIILFQKRYIGFLRICCSNGDAWLFCNGIHVPLTLHGCSVRIPLFRRTSIFCCVTILFQRRYMAVPGRNYVYEWSSRPYMRSELYGFPIMLPFWIRSALGFDVNPGFRNYLHQTYSFYQYL